MWSHLNVCQGQFWNGSTLLFVHLPPPHAPAGHATGRDWYRIGTLWGTNGRLAEWLKKWPPGAWHGTIPAPGGSHHSCYLTPCFPPYHSKFATERNLSIALLSLTPSIPPLVDTDYSRDWLAEPGFANHFTGLAGTLLPARHPQGMGETRARSRSWMGLSEPERVWSREERDLSPEEKEARPGVYLAPSGPRWPHKGILGTKRGHGGILRRAGHNRIWILRRSLQ